MPVLGSLAEVDAWAGAARNAGRTLPAILHVDTGMARLGLDARELAALQQDHARLAGIDLRYVMTHLVASEVADDRAERTPARALRRRLRAACRRRRAASPIPPAFSSATAGAPTSRGPGAALYGINPTPDRPNPMRLPVRLRARVLAVREVPPGESVGYNATWRAARPSRIATAAHRLCRWAAPQRCPAAAGRSLTAPRCRW